MSTKHSLFKCATPHEIAKNLLKSLILEFNVVQDHKKACLQFLLWHATCLCLSATIFTLN